MVGQTNQAIPGPTCSLQEATSCSDWSSELGVSGAEFAVVELSAAGARLGIARAVSGGRNTRVPSMTKNKPKNSFLTELAKLVNNFMEKLGSQIRAT